MFALTFETLKAWCERQSYAYGENPQLGQVAVKYELLGAPAPLMFLPQLDRGMVMLAMKQPFTVPAARRAAMLEATAILNARVLMGAWVLREDGEVFFRVTVPALDVHFGDQGMLHVARIVVGTSERAAPLLRAVALDGADPATLSQV